MYSEECVRYAQEFALFFQNDHNIEDLSDVWADYEILEDMAWCAFEKEVEEVEASDAYDQMDGKVIQKNSDKPKGDNGTPRSTFGFAIQGKNGSQQNLLSMAFSKVFRQSGAT